MTVKIKAAKGSFLLTLGEAVIYGCSFIRNMILARLLTKADFGIAATFAMIISLLEMSARLGISRFVVRDKEGDTEEFIASAHLVQFGAAFLSALLILALASPLAMLFGIPGQARAVMVLALVAFFRCFEHLDVRRFERHLRFGPSLMVEALPQVIITIAAWPIGLWLRDYRAVLLLVLAKALLSAVGSHIFAERKFRWGYNRDYVMRMLRFGWPLLVNGILMFGVLQGNQFLVASFYDMAELGAFAAASALTMAPTFFFGRVFNTVAFPVLAQVQDSSEAFTRRYKKALGAITLFSVVVSCGAIISAEALMRVVYGSQYIGTGIILAWLAAANAFRNLRMATSLAALAKGDSKNEMYSNSWRLVALLPALCVALLHKPVWWIACTGLIGEAFSCWISFQRLSRRDKVPVRVGMVPAGWILLLISAAGVLSQVGIQRFHPFVSIALAAVLALAAGTSIILISPDLRMESLHAMDYVKKLRTRRELQNPVRQVG
jgi:O-antigen/teichoic acid export membrane protein